MLAVLTLVPIQAASPATATNAVAGENAKPGTTAWQIPRSGMRISSDATQQIKGYASATSVNVGGTIGFHTSVNPAQSHTIEIFRLGWYGGAGGRFMTTIGPIAGTQQPACPIQASGLVECRWARGASLTVPSTWVSGVYVAILTNASNFQNYVPFVVRNDATPAALLYQRSVTTDQAYNDYGGRSLYSSPRAPMVSFDRPFLGNGAGYVFKWEINYIRWLERSGYDVSYSTDIDTHEHGERLRAHRGFLSVGHDEYWSGQMYDAAVAARDAGTNLGFFGANAVYWKVRFGPSFDGRADRVMTCYKTSGTDPVKGSETTGKFRNLGRPEQPLIGVQFSSVIASSASYVVTDSGHWAFAGTGFRDGDRVPGIVGYEIDRRWSNVPSPIAQSAALLSSSPVTTDAGTADVSNSSMYQAPSGAWVFGAGTIQWSWALDSYGGRVPDPRIQRTTANILDRFVGSSSTPTTTTTSSTTTTTSTTSTTAPSSSSCPCSIWGSTPAPPIAGDTRAVEVGVKFRSVRAGRITGLRFYKGTGNTGTHVGHLWDASGHPLAQVTFSGETASGWQQASLPTPVAIAADTTYVASYFAPVGRYAKTGAYFGTNGYDAPPLRALANTESGGNGVYRYTTTGGFPTSASNASNYWVDVVFADS